MEFYALIILAMIVTLVMGGTIVLFFIRYHVRLFRHQQELLRATIESEERERKRIGRDLHDEVGTALSQIRHYIERHLPETHAGQDVFGRQTKLQIDRVIHDVRNISHYLSPESIDLYGFAAAVEELVEIYQESSGLYIHLTNETGDILDDMDQTQSLALYRVLKELLTNTIKHAAANQVQITFQMNDGKLSIAYHDNGRGLCSGRMTTKGIGLKNIESRLQLIGAVSHTSPSIANGFSMHISVPVKKSLSNGSLV